MDKFKRSARIATAVEVVEDRLIYRRNVRGSLVNLLWPILCWYMTYHLYLSSLTVLFMVTMTIPSQITYFLNLLGPGKTGQSIQFTWQLNALATFFSYEGNRRQINPPMANHSPHYPFRWICGEAFLWSGKCGKAGLEIQFGVCSQLSEKLHQLSRELHALCKRYDMPSDIHLCIHQKLPWWICSSW